MSRSDIFFLAVLLTFPLQLNKFFFLNFSYVLGLPIDYRAPAIYLSDFFVLGYILIFLLENFSKPRKIFKNLNFFPYAIFAFDLYLLLNSLFFSISPQASFYFAARIISFSILCLFSTYTIAQKRIKKPALLVLTFSIFWQSVLIIVEFTFHKSQGLWFLGERTFDAATPAIAHFELLGNQILRPYGTFPHPNVAGAFLSFGLILIASGLRKKTLSSLITPAFTLLASILTFSKTTLFILGLALIWQTKKLRFLIFELIIGALALFALIQITLSSQLSSLAERLLLIQSTLDISLINPAFGIGSNNFILALSKFDLTSLSQTRLLQPVHNIFLLILAENGIVGLLLFTLVLFSAARNINSKIKALMFLALLIYGSVDHFLWTLEQGQLMFWLALAYLAQQKKG